MEIFHTEQSARTRGCHLYFDIETTGLAWNRSHIYLIGCSHAADDGTRVLTQWFLRSPGRERDLLLSFADFIGQYLGKYPDASLIHYNGNTFDLPYLRHKLKFYALHDTLQANSVDLYADVRPYRGLLQLNAMRQRDLEPLFGVDRDDPYDGGELIRVYHDYLQTGDHRLFRALIEHNRADVEGLISLESVRLFRMLCEGRFSVIEVEPSVDGILQFRLQMPYDLPLKRALHDECAELVMEKENASIILKPQNGRRKHYFSPASDYYYLPEEDYAIHKQIGSYVDRAHRVQATAATCYQWVEGSFIPSYGTDFSPLCFSDADNIAWIRTDKTLREKFLTNTDGFTHSYLSNLLNRALRLEGFRF